MAWIHAAGEWLRLSQHYRGVTDGELIAIARDRSKLTEIAQQILAQELSQRKLESRSRGAANRARKHKPRRDGIAGRSRDGLPRGWGRGQRRRSFCY